MDSLFILVPIAVLMMALAVRIFFWAVDNGQFDDLEGPAHSILFDEKQKKKKGHTDSNHSRPSN